MNNKQKRKYLIAVYSVILLTAIILAIVAYHSASSNFKQSTLLNLATELLGVFIIFVLVNRIFSLDEWNLSERINLLLNKIENSEEVSSDKFFHNKNSIKAHISNAEKIRLCGATLSTTIDNNLSDFRDFLRKGGELKILVMKNVDENLKFASNRSEDDNSKTYYENKLNATMHNIKYLNTNTKNFSKKYSGQLLVGVLLYPPSIGIQIFENNHQNRTCIIEMYAHHVGWGESPHFTLDSDKDSNWYTYFEKQFDAMWEKSEKITLEI